MTAGHTAFNKLTGLDSLLMTSAYRDVVMREQKFQRITWMVFLDDFRCEGLASPGESALCVAAFKYFLNQLSWLKLGF